MKLEIDKLYFGDNMCSHTEPDEQNAHMQSERVSSVTENL